MGKKTWSQAHLNWLMSQKFEYPEHRLVFEEMMMAMRQAQERLERLEQAIRAAVPDWSLADLVTALMAMHQFNFGGNVSGGDRRPLAFSIAVRTDGLSWAGSVRGFDRRLR